MKKWTTICEYVDLETGELITKSKFEREYILIKKSIKYEENEKYRIRSIRNECRKSAQLTIWR